MGGNWCLELFLKRKKVVIYLLGGCGNQLFALAASLFVCQQHNFMAVLSTKTLRKNKLEIENLNLPNRIQFSRHRRYPKFITWLIYRGIWLFFYNSKDEMYESHAELEKQGNIVTLCEYFQDARIAFAIREEMLIAAREEQINVQANLIKSGIDLENSCAIHIRGTDYLSLSQIYQNLSDDYYNLALAKLKEHRVDKYVIFSDDIDHAKSVVRALSLEMEKVVFFEELFEFRPLQTILAISNFRYVITSNSTFSWWAGFLNISDEPIIVQPKSWFVESNISRQQSKLLVNGWIQISN